MGSEDKEALEGQTGGDAPTLMGDWIMIQTNGAGSKTIASNLVAINSHDAKKSLRQALPPSAAGLAAR